MYPSYTRQACVELLDQLIKQKKLSQLEYCSLQDAVENSATEFCNELVAIYQDRVQQYLEDTVTHLSVILKLPMNVAEDISIGFAYSVLAQTHFCLSPFALLSLFSGQIYGSLQAKSDEKDFIVFMKKQRATLGVALGFYSIETYLWSFELEIDRDEATHALLKMQRHVFIHLVSLWQMYQELGFKHLACIATTLKSETIPLNFLKATIAGEQLLKQLDVYKEFPPETFLHLFFSDAENFSLLKQSLSAISNYIQHDLLRHYFDVYFQKQDSSNEFHKKINQLFSYNIKNARFDLKNPTDRVNLMLRIYFSSQPTAENFIVLYPSLYNQLQNTFNTFQKLCGNMSSKFRLIDRTIQGSPFAVDILQTKTKLLFDTMRDNISAEDQEKNNLFKEVEDQLSEKDAELGEKITAVHNEQQQAITKLENGLLENRNRLAAQANSITQFEQESAHKLDADFARLNQNLAECKENINKYCANRFFAGATFTITTTQTGPGMSLNQIKL